MKFIVIEAFNDTYAIVTDEEGETKVFEAREAAQSEANDCQHGIVVEV